MRKNKRKNAVAAETALQRVKNTDGKLQSNEVCDGACFEVPNTRPFEGFSYVKKEWVDQQDSVESVAFSYVFSHINAPADWDRLDSHIMMPQWGTSPLKRNWIVRLPTHFQQKDTYLFHYFFNANYSDGSNKISDTFSELIVPKEIEYVDHSGDFTFIKLHWSLSDWSYPQDTSLEVDGINWGTEYSVSHLPYRAGDRLFECGRATVMKRIPAPRIFRAIIWAPRGAHVSYCFKLIKIDKSGKAHEKWDNNNGKDFKIII